MSQTKAQLISDLVQSLNFTGTSAAPTNGMYLSAANTIKLATNSTGRLTIDSSGNAVFTGTCTATTFIGALTGNVTGNASGSAATVTGAAQTAITSVGTLTGLTVAGGQITGNSSNATKYVRMYGGSGTGQWDIYGHGANLRFSDNASAGYIVFDHRIGIGTTAPTQALSVNAGSTDSAIAIFTGDDLNRGLKISTATENSQTDMLVQLEAQGQHSGAYEGEISLKTANSHRLRIDKAGNVGIGTTTPSELLDVEGTIECLNELRSKTGNDLKLNAGSANRDVFLQVNDSTLMTLQGSTGKVGIGTTSPSSALTVTGSAGGGAMIYSAGGTNGGVLELRNTQTSNYTWRLAVGGGDNAYVQGRGFFIRDENDGATRFALNDAGRCGINRVNPQRTLDIETLSGENGFCLNTIGTAPNYQFDVRDDGTVQFRIDPSGRLLIGTETVGHANADELTIGPTTAGSRGGLTINAANDKDCSIHFGDSDSNLSGQINYDHDGDKLAFYTGGTKRIRIDSDGLKFGVSSSASDALDDYEEGTFSPALTGTTTNPSYTTSTVTGEYTKIGNICHIQILIIVTGVSSQGSGNWNITGMPFASGGTAYSPMGIIGYNDIFATYVSKIYISGSTLVVVPDGVTQSNQTYEQNALSTGYFSITLTYKTS